MTIKERDKYLNKTPLGKCGLSNDEHLPQYIKYAGHEPNPLVCIACGEKVKYLEE